MSILGAAAISGGFGLLNGIVSGLGQKSANEAMLQATRETNEQNYKIWQEQQSHNVDMFNMQNQANIDAWNMNNEYNDPSAQRVRLEQAGYNPMLLQGSSNISGSSSSPAQGATAQPAQSPTMQAPPPDAFTSPAVVGLQASLQGLEKMSQMLYTNQQTESESQKLPLAIKNLKLLNDDAQLDFEMKKYFKESGYFSDKLFNDWKHSKASADFAWNSSLISDLTINTQVDLEKAKLATMNATLALTMCDVEAKNIINSYLDEQQQKDLALKVGELALQIKQGKLTDTQIEKLISSIAVDYANAGYLNSLRMLNLQEYDFKNSMNSLLLEGQKLHNESVDISNSLGIQQFLFNERNMGYLTQQNKNLAMSGYFGTELQKLQYVFQYNVLPSMIDATIGENNYKAKFFTNKSIIEQNKNDNFNGRFGNLWRNLGGFGSFWDDNIPVNLKFGK